MNIENEFNEQVEVPNVPTPVEVDKFTYKSGQITYAQQRFEDNSIKMWGTILEDAGRTWKTLKEINNASKKITMAETEQKIKSAKFEKNAVLEYIADQRRKATAVIKGQMDAEIAGGALGKDLIDYNLLQKERRLMGIGDRMYAVGEEFDHPTYVPLDGGFAGKGVDSVDSVDSVEPINLEEENLRPNYGPINTEAWAAADDGSSSRYSPNPDFDLSKGEHSWENSTVSKMTLDTQNVGRGEYGLRADGSGPKGPGFLGAVMDDEGWTMTELSVGVHPDGLGMENYGDVNSVDIPTLVPGLTDKQLKYLKAGGDPRKNEAIMANAVEHARAQIEQGLPVFYGDEVIAPAATPTPATAPANLSPLFQEKSHNFHDNIDRALG